MEGDDDSYSYSYDHHHQRSNQHGTTILQKLQSRMPTSTQVVGFVTLVFSGCILVVLTGVTLTAVLLGVVFFTPLVVLSSPIWFPVGMALFVAVAGFLMTCGFAVSTVAAATWVYRYFRGWHPVGSERVDYARSRIFDTARDYGGYYLHTKVLKDAAPGA